MDWAAIFTAVKPIASQGARDGLRIIGTLLATHGFLEGGAGTEAFIGAGMTLAGLFWGWFTTKGYVQAGALLKKLTAQATHADAVKAAEVLPPAAAVDTALKATTVKAVVSILLFAFALSAFLAGAAQAQVKPLAQIQQDIDAAKARLAAINQQVAAAASNARQQVAAAADPAAPLACDFKMFIHFTPENLVPTLKGCFAKTDSRIVDDVTNALKSAQTFGGGPKGDGDGVNCLTPALEIVKAGAIAPYVPAVMSSDGTTVVAPEVPAKSPGLVTLYQKYREFTLAGGLTACQTWFNGPVQMTLAAGAGGVATVAGGAALLVH